jgi:cholesterol transport system auxiliary component
VLNRTSDRTLVEDRLFEARVKADGNRVSAIVAAFGVATGRLLDDLVSWTSQKATSVPA